MKRYAIMQEPGPAAQRTARRTWEGSVFGPRPKRAGTVEASTETEALERFIRERYIETRNRQYRGHHVARGGRLVVTLANGRYVHEVIYHAWKEER